MTGGTRKNVTKNIFLGIILCISLQEWIPRDRAVVDARKTASRSSLVATSQLEAPDDGYRDPVNSDEFDGLDVGNIRNLTAKTVMERLRRDLFLFPRYDKTLPPVLQYNKSVDVVVDMTYRQVLDLDEKNQILKSLIWYRQYWKDEHLTWNPEEYDGIKEVTVPSTSVWRPDIAVYEEVGTRDLNPRLPFIKLTSTGNILYAEPTILETSCSVDTAFFPFDSQFCSMTFVSWSQSVTSIDLLAKRNSSLIHEDSMAYFIATGEWVLDQFAVKKQIARYGLGSETGKTVEVVNDLPKNAFASGSGKRYTDVPATKETSPEDVKENLTNEMYAEVRYTLVIRRNSSLYMQSMLFPSILLTSVALLGFYLPPDSGERVGLQITILLTFMVFLLTVGEMFPASTGPYIGVYFVLSMGQLGVNILMTIIVLHIHFKPCLRNKSSWKSEHTGSLFSSIGSPREPDSMIPVNLRRFLQFCNRYVAIADDGVTWMLPITSSTLPINKAGYKYKPGKMNSKEDGVSNSNSTEQKHEAKTDRGDNASPYKRKKSQENCVELEKVSVLNEDKGLDVVQFKPPNLVKTGMQSSYDQGQSGEEKSPESTPRTRRKTGREDELHEMMNSFRLDVKDIVTEGMRKKLQDKDEDSAIEESMEKEQEEWRSVARAVDRLFFRLYLLLMAISYVTLLGAAIRRHFSMEWDM